jgi:hypothetical protein
MNLSELRPNALILRSRLSGVSKDWGVLPIADPSRRELRSLLRMSGAYRQNVFASVEVTR